MEVNDIGMDYLIKLFGFIDEKIILVPSEQLFVELQEISDLWDSVENIQILARTKREIIRDAKDFLNSKFKLHRIPYKRLLNELDYQFMLHIKDSKMVAKLCNGINLMINPFHLPLYFAAEDDTEAMVVSNGTVLDDPVFFEHIIPSYNRIMLSKNITDLSSSSYVHEITHTQLSKVRGIIKHLNNREVIPIFLELLHVYEKGNINAQIYWDIIRINELIDHVDVLYDANLEDVDIEGDLLESSIYAESILKAYGLLLEYINGTEALKKYILRSIQNVFDGNLVLEELLEECEITESSVLENKRLLKYMEKQKKRI